MIITVIMREITEVALYYPDSTHLHCCYIQLLIGYLLNVRYVKFSGIYLYYALRFHVGAR